MELDELMDQFGDFSEPEVDFDFDQGVDLILTWTIDDPYRVYGYERVIIGDCYV